MSKEKIAVEMTEDSPEPSTEDLNLLHRLETEGGIVKDVQDNNVLVQLSNGDEIWVSAEYLEHKLKH